MPPPDLYTIRNKEGGKGEQLQLGEIVKRCEQIALHNSKAYFVGRETIRGRLRHGVRTWDGLTARVATHTERVKNHHWRSGPNGKPATKPTRTLPEDRLYEPEGPITETLDQLLGRK